MEDMKQKIVESILSKETGAEAIAAGTLFMLGAIDAMHDELMIINNRLVDIEKKLKKDKPKILVP